MELPSYGVIPSYSRIQYSESLFLEGFLLKGSIMKNTSCWIKSRSPTFADWMQTSNTLFTRKYGEDNENTQKMVVNLINNISLKIGKCGSNVSKFLSVFRKVEMSTNSQIISYFVIGIFNNFQHIFIWKRSFSEEFFRTSKISILKNKTPWSIIPLGSYPSWSYPFSWIFRYVFSKEILL